MVAGTLIRYTVPMKKFMIIALAAWFSFSFAQDTASQDTTSCAALLEPPPLQDQANAAWSNLQSVEADTTATQTVEGESVALAVRILFDLTNQRIYQTTNVNGEEVAVLRYADGKASMTMPGVDENLPTPPGLEAQFQQQLEQMSQNVLSDPTAMWGESEIVSCDGLKQYGDVLTGEQVTVRLQAGEGNALLQTVVPDMPVQLIYVKGQAKGVVQELPELGPTLMVFDVTQNSEGLVERVAIQQYSWDGSVAEATGTTTVNYSYDVPIDETLFNP